MARASALLVSHGAPTVALEDHAYARSMRDCGRPAAAPTAVVVVSAHREAPPPIRVKLYFAP